MRYFNTHGPVEVEKHYVVSRQGLADELKTQIDQGKYFTIFAPRQMGKTTLLRKLNEMLAEDPDYLPIPISFERYESWSVTDFMDSVANLIEYHIIKHYRLMLIQNTKRLTLCYRMLSRNHIQYLNVSSEDYTKLRLNSKSFSLLMNSMPHLRRQFFRYYKLGAQCIWIEFHFTAFTALSSLAFRILHASTSDAVHLLTSPISNDSMAFHPTSCAT